MIKSTENPGGHFGKFIISEKHTPSINGKMYFIIPDENESKLYRRWIHVLIDVININFPQCLMVAY